MPPTSVEVERAFSAVELFIPILSDESVNCLSFLREYFQSSLYFVVTARIFYFINKAPYDYIVFLFFSFFHIIAQEAGFI